MKTLRAEVDTVRKVGEAMRDEDQSDDGLRAMAASFCENVEPKVAKLEEDMGTALSQMSAVMVLFCEAPSDSGCDVIFDKLAKMTAELILARDNVQKAEKAAP
eukprot:SAG31_NODE_14540_length_800_cov_1.506419_1_plen_102_part_10